MGARYGRLLWWKGRGRKKSSKISRQIGRRLEYVHCCSIVESSVRSGSVERKDGSTRREEDGQRQLDVSGSQTAETLGRGGEAAGQRGSGARRARAFRAEQTEGLDERYWQGWTAVPLGD